METCTILLPTAVDDDRPNGQPSIADRHDFDCFDSLGDAMLVILFSLEFPCAISGTFRMILLFQAAAAPAANFHPHNADTESPFARDFLFQALK